MNDVDTDQRRHTLTGGRAMPAPSRQHTLTSSCVTPYRLDQLREQFGRFYLLPEGGSNELALRGCAELQSEIAEPFDVICCPCGTGGTLAGIAAGLEAGREAIGFSVLKGGEFLNAEVESLQRQAFGKRLGTWRIEVDFHFGGFAKRSAELDAFIADFESRHGMELDWVYVAKMMYGVFALVEQSAFGRGTRIVAVITGPPFD